MFQMMRSVALLLLATSVSCDVICPNGSVCHGLATCCISYSGYNCCPYPYAVCCADLTHCCPFGFRCNIPARLCERVHQPWLNTPMAPKTEAQNPRSSLMEANKNPVSKAPESAGEGVIRCDSEFYCPDGFSCCQGSKGQWKCCPHRLGSCCSDGEYCCAYGYKCDSSSQSCNKWFS